MMISQKIIALLKNPVTAFSIMLLGTIGQSFHTYYITKLINPFTGLLATISSIILALFFSSGLIYFSTKQGLTNDISTRNKYSNAASVFQIFEVFVNLFYWVLKLAYKYDEVSGYYFDFSNWFTLVAAIPLAFALPSVLRYYAGEIKDVIEPTKQEVLEDKVRVLENKLNQLQNGDVELEFTSGDKQYKYNNVKIKL